MDADRNQLIEALTRLRPGVASKEFIEQSTHFILNETEIVSYNDSISISIPFDIGVKCAVESGLFYKLLNKMDKDVVSINLKKTKLVVECGDVKAELPVVIESPILSYINKLVKEQNDLEWHDVPSDFLEGIRLCAFSASTDKTLGTLTCVWFEGEDVLSCDKYRVSWYKMDKAVPNNFYIEAQFIEELLSFDNPTEYCLSKSWAHFQLPNEVIFSVKLVKPDELLPLRKKFEEFESEVRIPLPGALREAIETVWISVEKEERIEQTVTIEFSDDLVRCIGKSKQGAKIEREIHLHNPIEIGTFAIETSPKSLIEVLDKATHLLVGKNRGLFKSREHKGFQHLLGLIVR